MEIAVQKADKITDMKNRMSDIYLSVSWREISRTYFEKSVPWFQHKMYGIDGNGGVGGFTPEEAQQLRGALAPSKGAFLLRGVIIIASRIFFNTFVALTFIILFYGF